MWNLKSKTNKQRERVIDTENKQVVATEEEGGKRRAIDEGD